MRQYVIHTASWETDRMPCRTPALSVILTVDKGGQKSCTVMDVHHGQVVR